MAESDVASKRRRFKQFKQAGFDKKSSNSSRVKSISNDLARQPPVGRSVSCKGDIQTEPLARLRNRKARRREIVRASLIEKNYPYACTIEKNEGHVVEASRTSSFLCFSFSLSPPSPCTSPPFPALYLWPQREST